MPTCHICVDSKKCTSCGGNGHVACSCRTGSCERCGGNGRYRVDRDIVTCTECNGQGQCSKCRGTAILPCASCKSNGYCPTCYQYRLTWKQASDMAKSGDVYNAVVVLQEMLKEFDEKKHTNTTVGRTAGVGIGATIGTVIFPGIGTIIGAAVGGLLGNHFGEDEAKSRLSFEAETNYRIGVIYEMLHHPSTLGHYQQAKLLDGSHQGAHEALQRIRPQILASAALNSLDDDI